MSPNSLIEFLDSIHPISPELKNHLLNILKVKNLAKKEFLLKIGQTCRNVYFIQTGLVRAYYLNDGAEISSWFMKEGDVIFSIESFYSQTPAYEYIQCLEDCVVFYVSYQELQDIYNKYVEFNYIGRLLTEKYYALTEKKLRAFRMHPAKDRYEFLEQNHADLIGRVPDQYLASYIGLRKETLSREKKR
jgi:CRP-like cAMP-binding protein